MKIKIFILSFFISFYSFGQQTLSGIVYDNTTKTPLIGAQLYFYKNKANTLTDNKGKFSLELYKYPDSAIVSYLGYRDTTIQVISGGNKKIYLHTSTINAPEVVITSKASEENITLAREEVFLTRAELMNIPALMGEADIIRSFSSNAGIQQFEGMQGLYVRGGSQDQNLIIFDDAIVYNPSHLLGFFSVFNPEIINDAKLYKSGTPAKFGGRLSSVLQINSKKPSTDKFEFDGSVGIISGRLACNIPITKHSAATISLRKSYIEAFILPLANNVIGDDEENHMPLLGFTDANIKYAFTPNSRNSFSISGYWGRDKFSMEQKSLNSLNNIIKWGNSSIVGNWLYTSKSNTVFSTSLSYSDYIFFFNLLEKFYNLTTETGIKNINFRHSASKRYNKHLFSIGIEDLVQQFNLGNMTMIVNDKNTKINNPQESISNELSLFIEDSYDISDRFNIIAGIRGMVYSKPDSTHYNFISVNPRIQGRYLITSQSSVKLSVSRETQNLHLVSILSSALPADIWFPATETWQPEKGMLYSLGLFKNFKENKYETSISVFYKQMNNLMEFKSTSLDFYTSNFFERITNGKGIAFGTELSISKRQGQWQGSVSYSFSRTLRKFAELNNGYWYPANYDRPHDINISLSYTTNNKKWNFSAYWVYNSGKTYSESSEYYLIENNIVSLYQSMNNSRMPAYHRLDLSADRKWILKNKFEMHWQFSLYNAYNHTNPYMIFYQTITNDTNSSIKIEKDIIGLFPLIPSISLKMHLL